MANRTSDILLLYSENNSCEYYDEKLLSYWVNQSNWNEVQLIDYACAYLTFRRFQRSLDYFKWVLYLAGGCIGITSAILALITFTQREFSAVSFLYHRAINAIELPFMLLMIERSIRDYKSTEFLHSYTWATFFARFSGKIDNALPTWVNVITLFVAVERAVACLAPRHFVRMNRPCVVWAVVFGALCIAVAIWAPSCFAHEIMFDNRTTPVRYMPVWTEWGKSASYEAYESTKNVLTIIGAVLLTLASLSAVIGLRRTAARSLQRNASSRTLLAAGGAPPVVSTAGGVEYWCLLKQLSYLQLCETIPLIILHALLIVIEGIKWNYQGGGKTAPLERSYDEAMEALELARSRQLVNTYLDVSNILAHCVHFYWYLLFCPKVRRGFLGCLRYGPYGRGALKNAAHKMSGSRNNNNNSVNGDKRKEPKLLLNGDHRSTIILRQPLLSAAPLAAESAIDPKSTIQNSSKNGSQKKFLVDGTFV